MSFLLLIFNLFIHLLVVSGDFFWNDRVLELSDQENFKRFPRRDRLHSATVAGNANSINWHRTQTRIFAYAVIRGPRVVPHCFRMFGEKVDLKTLLICVCLFILATGKLAMVETVHPLGGLLSHYQQKRYRRKGSLFTGISQSRRRRCARIKTSGRSANSAGCKK